MGQIVAGDTVPEFEAALDRMDEGEISAEPVTTRFGLHILRLDARAPGAVLPWTAVAPRLRAAAEKAAWVKASRDFARRLADSARIEGLALDTGTPARPGAARAMPQGAHP
jgi:peptidyl-prolyl cis-trans isomerase C